MDDNNVLNRHPRYDMDFTYKNPVVSWVQSEDSSSWVYTALVLIWVVGVAALILYVCAHSPGCLCYVWLCKLRHQPYRPHTGAECGEDWASPQVRDETSHRPLIPSSPSSLQPDPKKIFPDLPPAYSEVMKCDLPTYPTGHISGVIPDREWTPRAPADNTI